MWSSIKYEPPKKAIVNTFLDGKKEFIVESVHFWKGEPLRLYCKDKNGKCYKFKMDEEPFTLIND